jgi:hypothetical protein
MIDVVDSVPANTSAPITPKEMERMARRRFQRGSLVLRGTRRKVWVARWREDVILANGSVQRVRNAEVLGTLQDYKTKRLCGTCLRTATLGSKLVNL